jgi:hypothetical protein
MDHLVSIPVRDLSKFDGEEIAYASKFRRICFNPFEGFNLLWFAKASLRLNLSLSVNTSS